MITPKGIRKPIEAQSRNAWSLIWFESSGVICKRSFFVIFPLLCRQIEGTNTISYLQRPGPACVRRVLRWAEGWKKRSSHEVGNYHKAKRKCTGCWPAVAYQLWLCTRQGILARKTNEQTKKWRFLHERPVLQARPHLFPFFNHPPFFSELTISSRLKIFNKAELDSFSWLEFLSLVYILNIQGTKLKKINIMYIKKHFMTTRILKITFFFQREQKRESFDISWYKVHCNEFIVSGKVSGGWSVGCREDKIIMWHPTMPPSAQDRNPCETLSSNSCLKKVEKQ